MLRQPRNREIRVRNHSINAWSEREVRFKLYSRGIIWSHAKPCTFLSVGSIVWYSAIHCGRIDRKIWQVFTKQKNTVKNSRRKNWDVIDHSMNDQPLICFSKPWTGYLNNLDLKSTGMSRRRIQYRQLEESTNLMYRCNFVSLTWNSCERVDRSNEEWERKEVSSTCRAQTTVYTYKLSKNLLAPE